MGKSNHEPGPALRWGVEISVLVHGAMFLWLTRTPPLLEMDPLWARADPIVVDLTRPYRLTSDPRKAFRSTNPGTGAPRVDNPTPLPFKAGGGIAGRGVEWTLPTPVTHIPEIPTETGDPLSKSTGPATGTGTAEGPSQGLGGLGTGGDGEVDWVYLTETPRLLNREELMRNVIAFYPKAERQAGRESRVVAHVRLNRDGKVSGVDIQTSGGASFDEAARRVLSLATFSPARQGDRAVGTQFVFPIDFQISE